MKLTLPLPPSKNDLTRRMRMPGGGYREYPTDARLNFVATVKRLGLVLKAKPIESGPVEVDVKVYRGEKRGKSGKVQLQRGDLANYEEILFDALQGVAYRNDSQIRRKTAELFEDRANPRVEVTIQTLGGA